MFSWNWLFWPSPLERLVCAAPCKRSLSCPLAASCVCACGPAGGPSCTPASQGQCHVSNDDNHDGGAAEGTPHLAPWPCDARLQVSRARRCGRCTAVRGAMCGRRRQRMYDVRAVLGQGLMGVLAGQRSIKLLLALPCFWLLVRSVLPLLVLRRLFRID